VLFPPLISIAKQNHRLLPFAAPSTHWLQIRMASFGRLLQIVGLVVPPLSIVLQLQEAITLGQMLLAVVAAVSAFWIGRIVEGYARQ
jgi:hypothetical protein